MHGLTVYKHAYLNTLLLLLKEEVAGHALNSHGNYIVDHGKSWKNHRTVFFFKFLQGPCFKLIVLWTSVKNTIIISVTVSNKLDPDQAQQIVGPDLGPNCLQRLSVDNYIATSMGKS